MPRSRSWPPLKQTPWDTALKLLAHGRPEQLALLLEKGGEIHPEAGKILACALRGGEGLPFRLVLTGKAKQGQGRSGRWPALTAERDIRLAAAVQRERDKGHSVDAAARSVAKRVGVRVGDRAVKAAYEKHKDLAVEIVAAGQDFVELEQHGLARLLARLRSQPT
jgi:hypothetical protein